MTEIVHAGHCCLNCLQPSCTFLLDLFPVCFFSSLCGLMPGDSAWKILQTSDPAFPQRPRTFIYATITISLSQQILLKDKWAQRQQWKPRRRAIITRVNHQGNLTQMCFSGSTCILEICKGKYNIHTQSTEGELQCSQTLSWSDVIYSCSCSNLEYATNLCSQLHSESTAADGLMEYFLNGYFKPFIFFLCALKTKTFR